jgi:hypothetical protein
MHPTLQSAAEARYGLFTTAEARRAGYGPSEIRSLCTSGQWVRVRRGVLMTAADLATGEQRGHRHRIDCVAVLLSLDRPTAAISHGSAARLWNLPMPRPADPLIRLTDPSQWRQGPGWRMTCAPLMPAERRRSGPLRLTAVQRTLVDCAREWSLDDAVVAIDAAVLAELTTVDQVRAAAAEVHHWPGAARAARAASLADGRAESPLETRGRLRIVGAGLPSPELQVEIWAGGRRVAVVDAWFEQAAVAVEFDGRVKYSDPWRGRSPERVLWEEKRREDELRGLDIRVMRMADADLGSRWKDTETQLARLLKLPGPSARLFTAVPRAHGVRRTG